MLYKCLIKYKGTTKYVEELRYSEGPLQIDPTNIISCITKTFRYKANGPVFGLVVSPLNGKKYLVPKWEEVHPNTNIEDISYPKLKPKTPPQTFKIKDYTIKYNENQKIYVCNCQGYFRVKDRSIGCKHVQELKRTLAK
mgnify:CR=1 FL=1